MPPEENTQPGPLVLGALGLYLLLVGIVATAGIVTVFPDRTATPVRIDNGEPSAPVVAEPHIDLEFGDMQVLSWTVVSSSGWSAERGMFLLAILAGLLGSFIHAAQSFAAYVGNQQMKMSWTLWYVIRPPIGAVLGLVFYVLLRAGFTSATSSGVGSAANMVNPYGVIAFGVLAGCFSQMATKKLKEVFEALFRPRQDDGDKLTESEQVASITAVDPATVPAGADAVELTIRGARFAERAEVLLDRRRIDARRVSDEEIVATVPADTRRALAGSKAELTVVNPTPEKTPSKPFVVEFLA